LAFITGENGKAPIFPIMVMLHIPEDGETLDRKGPQGTPACGD